jgi:hypothetical protein
MSQMMFLTGDANDIDRDIGDDLGMPRLVRIIPSPIFPPAFSGSNQHQAQG